MGDAGGTGVVGPQVDPQEAVDQLFGAGRARVVDAVTSTKVTEQEVILVNGVPVQLVGEDGDALKAALLSGRLPDQALVNRVLASVLGAELRGVTKVESNLTMTSRVTTKDTLTVHQNGRVVDERSSETHLDTRLQGHCADTLPPLTAPSIFSSPATSNFSCSSTPSSLSSSPSPRPPSRSSNKSPTPLNGTGSVSAKGSPAPSRLSRSSSSSRGKNLPCTSVNADLAEALSRTGLADNTRPKNGEYVKIRQVQKGLPQTPKSGAKSCPYNGVEHASHAPEWATTPDDDNSLVYEDGVLVSGSLQALIQHAVPTAVYYPDTAYLFAFLLSSRLFIKPHELLQRVCDVGFTQQGLKGNDMSTINKEKLGRFVPHMVQLLGEWSETFPYDFRDERMMGGVRTMTHRCIALEPALRRDVTQVLHNLLNKLTQLERYEEGLAKMSPPPPADFIPQPTDITEVCESPLVMAQQLTHIELEKLSYIGPEEFVQAFAKDNLDACYKDLKKTSNLESYIQWFNRLSYLVATHACTHVKKKQRVRVIEWWIEVARECFNIGNFNSLMGIIAGLNMSIVSRLKKTWSKVQSAKFSVLEHQMDPSSNFSSYRSTLKAAMWRSAGAVDDRQKIVIPFFSLLVKDLYFLNEGCASRVKISESSSSSRLPNGHINFDKFWQLAKQVTEFMAWKQVTCPFEKVPDVINYMQTTAVLTETGLALASFECEGPDNSYEKERYKSLKSDTQQPAEKTNPHD
ncbi:ras-GEF domain-containing family member 1B-like isoform X9 [Panulirus ornatus]|uniref:ras-GEF domain-containing family member 1B-like isoform X9 n=1 Tax=Panulirus ornatus TaxID=150431 RepID=UPI003A8C88AB